MTIRDDALALALNYATLKSQRFDEYMTEHRWQEAFAYPVEREVGRQVVDKFVRFMETGRVEYDDGGEVPESEEARTCGRCCNFSASPYLHEGREFGCCDQCMKDWPYADDEACPQFDER